MLHALRLRCTECKVNFKQKYLHSSLKCSLCGIEDEDQKHLLTCNVILKYWKGKNISVSKSDYEDIFSQDIRKQKEITTIFKETSLD